MKKFSIPELNYLRRWHKYYTLQHLTREVNRIRVGQGKEGNIRIKEVRRVIDKNTDEWDEMEHPMVESTHTQSKKRILSRGQISKAYSSKLHTDKILPYGSLSSLDNETFEEPLWDFLREDE